MFDSETLDEIAAALRQLTRMVSRAKGPVNIGFPVMLLSDGEFIGYAEWIDTEAPVFVPLDQGVEVEMEEQDYGA